MLTEKQEYQGGTAPTQAVHTEEFSADFPRFAFSSSQPGEDEDVDMFLSAPISKHRRKPVVGAYRRMMHLLVRSVHSRDLSEKLRKFDKLVDRVER